MSKGSGEIDFCGTPDFFKNLFANLRSEVQEEQSEPEVEAKKVKVKKEKKGKKKSPKSSKSKQQKDKPTILVEPPDITDCNTQELVDEDTANAKKLCDEFDDFLRTSKKVDTPIVSPSTIIGSDSPILIEDDDDSEITVVSEESNNDIIPVEVEEDISVPINIRVNWKGCVHKFRMDENNKIWQIRKLLSTAIEVNPNKILLFFNYDADEVELEDSKTIKEYNLTIGCVLQAIGLKEGESSSSNIQSSTQRVEKDPSMITLKLQVGTRAKDMLIMDFKKTAPFFEIQKIYAELMELQAEDVMFRVDGDIVDLDDTPDSLDLENEDCVDVVISS